MHFMAFMKDMPPAHPVLLYSPSHFFFSRSPCFMNLSLTNFLLTDLITEESKWNLV